MAEFTPFSVPVAPSDVPLVQHAGADYVCTGCREHVPDGAWIFETVQDGMVIGMSMRQGGPDGPVIHECGQVA